MKKRFELKNFKSESKLDSRKFSIESTGLASIEIEIFQIETVFNFRIDINFD